ncbi:spermidine/putrescine transport system substrate-binding protein/spermidine/putrescine transport system permease protein [Selenomonas ruminantium]|uniref:Spermidine/putrescine transport system substrate-binding protein/spermidine/putrescine transport system permease protein n=1 Tax=Selenomonas ruminantium TaxID=971 RepID=A0A1M6U039_SELRU|nr:ABC transporter substrate-binding protein [Selenomonas ruminantium]SHK62531.1 spermidine/putrescine transport system substrate-binding protein/spermidine/putrescine transport system permease protein [Selenomonas ruminantium]
MKFLHKYLRSLLLTLLVLSTFVMTGCDMFAEEEDEGADVLYVYSWGDYLSEDAIKQFEDETGIKVVLDEYDTNESMYPRIAEGAEAYDVLCPSDYMINKLIHNDLLQPLDFSQLPNARKNIGQDFFEQSKMFDREGKYSVPYCWGTVGIMYNTKMVQEPVDSWKILWDEKYKDNILMQDSARDAIMIPLRMLGYSMNTTNEAELQAARDLLIQQKPLVQAYGVDDIRDKLSSGEAALGVIFSGEAIKLMKSNPNLRFQPAPKEGTNVWIDSWVIPKNARHVENAHKFIDFMCRTDIAAANFEELGYSTPNTTVRDEVEEDLGEYVEVAFPPEEVYKGQESYSYLGEALDKLYTKLWLQVKVD